MLDPRGFQEGVLQGDTAQAHDTRLQRAFMSQELPVTVFQVERSPVALCDLTGRQVAWGGAY
ncbi:hypothetical protein GCM10010121_099290 [Streptomyces brasiliensis]|uniref:Uncharacterized protein n=1 Tax=Streptomyces brasiliensis TaxID=1954 RepID=A0A917PEE3_9ACTN|nr:hypothetical protein GCM10010121_099290 [Streptomyces brasiliensis]